MKITGLKSLPVAMYHYVNDLPGGITVSPECFADHCRVLAEKGWRGIGLDEAEEFLLHARPLPEKSLLLTFDDGYLDNYLYALPTLHQYGHQAVVFAVADRLEPEETPRAALHQVLAGAAAVPKDVSMPVRKTPQGFSVREDVFLNHAEARLMDRSGVFRVAAHGRGHYGVYTGPEFTGFFRPRTRYRTFYRTEEGPVFGLPEFPVKAGLTHRAFLPDPRLVEAVRGLVPQDFAGAADFFADPGNVQALEALVAGFAKHMGRLETDAEREARLWRELAKGKELLEQVLGHPLRTLCWPWGEYDALSLRLAKEAGFRLFFTTREGVNPPGQPQAIHRFKAKPQNGAWLASRAWLYSRPLLGTLYARLRI